MTLRRTALVLILHWLSSAQAAERPPHWSFEFKGGAFHSALDGWEDFYGNDRMPHYALAMGYKPWRPLDIGVEVGYRRDRGKGLAPLHGTAAGDVDYRLFPVQLTATLRGVFSETQWLVPYVGVGWGRFIYQVETAGQEKVDGATDGLALRAGLQLLLDPIDPAAATVFLEEYGVRHTYFFLEVQETEARTAGVDLGGRSYLGGLLFEF